MVRGDPSRWLGKFRNLERRFVDLLPAVWPRCVAELARLSPQPLENDITKRLFMEMKKQRRRPGRLCYQLALLEERPGGAVATKGFIDLVVLLGRDEDHYVAFECKRLNVAGDGGRASLAGPYVADGVARYVREQYARRLPLGGMIGYVLDGDLGWAEQRVVEEMARSGTLLLADSAPVPMPPVGCVRRLLTTHARPGESRAFEVWHTLVPFSRAPGGSRQDDRGRRRDPPTKEPAARGKG